MLIARWSSRRRDSAAYNKMLLTYYSKENDCALFKVEFTDNPAMPWLHEQKSFDYIEVSSRILDEGEPVYAVGYPLIDTKVGSLADLPDSDLPESMAKDKAASPGKPISFASLSARVTSAIVACQEVEGERLENAPDQPIKYVIDKALNYGNSGGPIVATESGKVFALCSEFQPVAIPQPQLPLIITPLGLKPAYIGIPSLYARVERLANRPLVDTLRANGIAIRET